MSLFPESTNDHYHGSIWAGRFLAFIAAITIVPGCIHAFLPDGGAGSIAGLDLAHSGAVIISAFAWAGATQIVHGLAMLAIALWYRSFVPMFLALVLVERIVMTLNWGMLKPAATGHRPPEVYITLLLLPVLVTMLMLSLRPSAYAPARRLPA